MASILLRDLPRVQIQFLGGEPGRWIWMVNDLMVKTKRDPSDLSFFKVIGRAVKLHGYICLIDNIPTASKLGWWINVVEGDFVFGCYVAKGALRDNDFFDILKSAQKKWDETRETVH